MAWLKAFGLACVATAMLAAPAHAQWKWKDARGQVHMSDLPPPRDIPQKDILQQPSAATVRRPPTTPAAAPQAASAASATAEAKAKVDPELEAKRKQADQEKATKAKAEEERLTAARADNCKRARDHLSALDAGFRVSRTNAKGEREFLDDKERAVEAARTREIITSECR